MKMTRKMVLMSLLALMLVAPGCNAARWFINLFQPYTEDEVAAKYAGIENSSVVVIVTSFASVECAHPKAKQKLGETICGELQTQIEGVKLIIPAKGNEYIAKNPNWRENMAAMGKTLGAEHILLVTLGNYSARQYNNEAVIQVRGEVVGEAALYLVSEKQDGKMKSEKVWPQDQDSEEITAHWPEEDNPEYGSDKLKIALQCSRRRFAEKLVKNFRDYRDPIDE